MSLRLPPAPRLRVDATGEVKHAEAIAGLMPAPLAIRSGRRHALSVSKLIRRLETTGSHK